jgi:hypothetical protein
MKKLALWAKDNFERLISQKANPRYFALFRMSYALVALPIAIQTIQYIPMRWFELPTAMQSAALISNWIWVGLLLLLLVGLGGRIVPFLIFLITPHLLDPTVGTKLLMIGAFWMAFMRTNECYAIHLNSKDRKIEFLGSNLTLRSVPGWAALFLGFNIGFLLFTAGISKSLDPLWFHGLGFYYSLLHPWLKVPYSSGLLDSKFLMYSLNYASLALEILVLPLLMWRRLRIFGAILIFLFFASLTFPLRIDPIGPAGLVLAIPLFAITPAFQSMIQTICGRLGFSRGKFEMSDGASRSPALVTSRWEKSAAVAISFLLIFDVLSVSAPALFAIEYPLINYPFKIEEHSEESISIEQPSTDQPNSTGSGLSETLASKNISGPLGLVFKLMWGARNIYRTLRGAQYNYTLVGWYSPFNLKHILGRYTYQILITMDSGKVKEPLIIFHDDKTTGPPSGGILRPRVLQNRMWAIGLLAHKLSIYDNYEPTNNEDRLLRSLIQFQLAKLSEIERKQARHVSIVVSPILLPANFAGNVTPWLEAPRTELFRYDIKMDIYALMEVPAKFEVNIDLPEFRSHRIILNP